MERVVPSLSASLVLLSLLELLLTSSAWADGDLVAVEVVDDAGLLMLETGRSLCLSGISPLVGLRDDAPEARSSWRPAWQRMIENGGFVHLADRPARHDRYGCLLTDLNDDERNSLAEALLAAGWAVADPVTSFEENAVIEQMLALEDGARRARRGNWAKAGPLSTDQLDHRIGSRQLVEGRVRRVYANDRYLYLNFGADWRTDFTVRLDRKTMEAGGLDAKDYDGKNLRIRGVVVRSRGPLIDIANLRQIEFLP